MTVEKKDLRDRPWHLIPQEIRERSAIANCEVDGAEGHSCGAFGVFGSGKVPDDCDCASRSEAFRVAAQVLREAAPYPDEALVFEYPFDRNHVELTDVFEDGEFFHLSPTVEVQDSDGVLHYINMYELRPLTISAREAWLEFGGDR